MIKRFYGEQHILNGEISIEKKRINGSHSLHWHDFFEIEFFLNGSGTYIVDGVEYNIKKGSLFFMSPMNFHELKQVEGDIVNIMFFPNACNQTSLYSVTGDNDVSSVEFSGNDFDFVKTTMEEIIKTKDHLYMSALLDVILYKIASGKQTKEYAKMSKIQMAMLYVRNNFKDNISLTDVSKQVGLSAAYLSSVFSKETGMTLKEYINSLKFNYAKKLILHSKMSIFEICYESGFNDYSSFYRGYKKWFNISPKAERLKTNKVIC